MNEVWAIVEPYIRREEQIREMRYMAFFNDLVVRFRQRSQGGIYRQRRLRRVSGGN